MAGECPGVEALDADNAVLLQPFLQAILRTPITGTFAAFFDNEPFDLRSHRFEVSLIDAIIPDQRIGHGDDLTFVGWIGQHFLVARQVGVEDHLAKGLARCSEGFAPEHGTVFKG